MPAAAQPRPSGSYLVVQQIAEEVLRLRHDLAVALTAGEGLIDVGSARFQRLNRCSVEIAIVAFTQPLVCTDWNPGVPQCYLR